MEATSSAPPAMLPSITTKKGLLTGSWIWVFTKRKMGIQIVATALLVKEQKFLISKFCGKL